ncbi:MAG: hypothetical protein V3V67_09640 [Myxococcota bacterium]
MDPAHAERKLAAILHADVAGYSRLMAEDEDATVRLVTAYREEVSCSPLNVEAWRGRPEAARELLVELGARAQAGYTSPVSLALVHLALAEPDEALEQLEHAYEARAFYVTHIGVEPRYDPLRSDARFQDLLRRMGLDDSAAPRVARATTS